MNLSLKIEEAMNQHNQDLPFSGAVFVEGEEKIFERGYGYANRSEKIANTISTRFAIASGSKILTAVAICQLVQEGVVTFDTYLKDCLNFPFPHFDPDITIHHLLTHSSGIPDYFDEEFMSDFADLWRDLPVYNMNAPQDFLPLFQNGEMKFSPGDRFSYNNGGYILLGLIVEQLSGLSFPAYIEKNIFQSCGMKDSGYFRMDQLPERTAFGYIDHNLGWKTNIYSVPIVGGPDGGSYTTVHDLVKFWNALFDNRLLSKEYINILLTPHTRESEELHYGYGVWILMKDNEIFKYFVMGSDPGVIMQSSVYAKHNIHAHILGNINKGAGMIALKIDEIIHKELCG